MSTGNQISQEQFEEIERFLQNQMSFEEEEAFKKKMEADKSLQEQANEIRLILMGVEESVLQDKLEKYHQEIKGATVKKLYSKRWLVAASIILCLFIATFWLLRSSKKNEKLFAEYFQPDPGLISSMSSSDNYTFDRAMVDYKTGHYNESIQAWKDLQNSNKSDTLDYFIASAYLSLKNSDSAIAYFQKVLSLNESVFKNEANWYMGLSLVLNNRGKEAIPFIEQSSHKEKEQLLSKLKQ